MDVYNLHTKLVEKKEEAFYKKKRGGNYKRSLGLLMLVIHLPLSGVLKPICGISPHMLFCLFMLKFIFR